MAKYRKKPVVIEAVKFNVCERGQKPGDFDGPLFDETPDWLLDAMKKSIIWQDLHAEAESDYVHLKVGTLEGPHTASPGDFIIRGVQGELYPCKPDIFEQTYELVEDE